MSFLPYGIFTPHTGSVSGIYIRLPQRFMKNATGNGVGTAKTQIHEAVPFAQGGTANSDYLPLLSFPESY